MIQLTDWYFSKHNLKGTNKKCYIAHGFVSGHPEIEDGTHIDTSIIEQIKLDKINNRLLMYTHSKNEYELLFADIYLEEFKKIQGYLHKFDIPALSLSECKKLQEKSKIEKIAKADSILKNNELYLKMVGVFVRKAFFKNNEGKVREIPVKPHIGMFQDSYLITDWEKHEVDFRYFDDIRSIRPYHWSDGLEAIQIENAGSTDLLFFSDDNLLCKAGEITLIESTQFGREGLFSPDVVNGKCICSEDIEKLLKNKQ